MEPARNARECGACLVGKEYVAYLVSNIAYVLWDYERTANGCSLFGSGGVE